MTSLDREPESSASSENRSPQWLAKQRARVDELRDAAETRRPILLPAALGVLALLMVSARAFQLGANAFGPAMFWSGIFIGSAGVLEIAVFYGLRFFGAAPAISLPHAMLRFLAVNGFHFAILYFAGMIGGSLALTDPSRGVPIVIAVLLSAVFFSFLFELESQEALIPIIFLLAAQLIPAYFVQSYSRVNHPFGRAVQREFRSAPVNAPPSNDVVIPGLKKFGPRHEIKPSDEAEKSGVDSKQESPEKSENEDDSKEKSEKTPSETIEATQK